MIHSSVMYMTSNRYLIIVIIDNINNFASLLSHIWNREKEKNHEVGPGVATPQGGRSGDPTNLFAGLIAYN